MKSYINQLLFALLLITNISAQMPDFSKEVQSAMSKISVMEGKWKGEGWRMNPDGSKDNSNVLEIIQFRLEKSVLLVEGLGTNDAGKIVHNALGIISFNPMTKQYSMKSFLSNGLSTEATFEVIESNKSFHWWFKDARGGTIKYKITIMDNNWNEVGEYSFDGVNWRKILEMNIKKVE